MRSVRKTKRGANLKRWFKEKWTTESGKPCGNSSEKVKKCRPSRRVSKDTPKTWGEMSPSEKKRAVKEKKRVGMGRKTSNLKRRGGEIYN